MGENQTKTCTNNSKNEKFSDNIFKNMNSGPNNFVCKRFDAKFLCFLSTKILGPNRFWVNNKLGLNWAKSGY